jgi:CHAT domain-containing protein/tetratricopeptide (TPR) repeat protein
MRPKTFFRLSIAAVLMALLPATFSQGPDEAGEIGQLIVRFFGAYSARDLKATMALFDPKFPDFDTSRQNFRQTFTSNRITVTLRGTPRTAVSGDNARSFIDTDINASDIRTGQSPEGFGRGEKLFDWKKVDGAWMIERYAPTEQQLADALIAAKTAADRSALVIARKELATPDLVRILDRSSKLKTSHGDTKDGLRLSDLAIEVATGIADRRALGWADLQKGDVLFSISNYEAALDLQRRGLAIFQQLKDRRGEAGARLNIGNVYGATSQNKDAFREYEASLTLSKGFDTPIESGATGNLGELYRRMGNLGEAMEYGKASLKISREIEDKPGIADSMLNVAIVWLTKGDFDTALGILNETLALYRDLDDPGGQGVALGNIGVAYEATARYEEALKTFEASLDLKRRVDDHEGEADTLNNIGIVMMETRRYDEALAKYEESYAVAVSIHSPRLQSEALANIGSLYRLKGNYRLALVNLNKALKIDQDNHERAAEAQTLSDMSEVYSDTGRAQDALATLQKTVRIFHSEDMKMEEATALSDIGRIRTERREYASAEADHRQSIEIRKRIVDLAGQADASTRLASLYRLEGRLEQSAAIANGAIAIARGIESPALEAAADITLAQTLQALKRSSDSREAYRTALSLTTGTGNPEISIAANTGLGELDIEGTHWDEAANECGLAIAEVERVRFAAVDPLLRIGYADRQSEPWNCRVTALIAMHRDEDALRTAEGAKARSLLDAMSGSKATDKGFSQSEKDEVGLLDARVAKLSSTLRETPSDEVYQRLVAAKRAADDRRRDLRLQHASVSIQEALAEPITLADTATLVPDNTALLEYAMGKDSSYLFVIRRPSPGQPPALAVIPLGIGRDRLRMLAENFREELDKKKPIDDVPEARLLYDALIAPARTALAGVTTLGIVPDDNMWMIPFAALRESSGGYLVQRWATFYAPSLTALGAMRKLADTRRPGQIPSLLLVGNPSLGPSHSLTLPQTEPLHELPFAEREVQLIAEVARKRGLRVDPPHTGASATESFVKSQMGRYSVIHLATHGFYDKVNPLYSAIVLAQVKNDKGQDGILEAREILDLELSASLVVLSACDTARGAVYAGESPIGLSWALFVAGTPSTLVTQWSVDDNDSTANLVQGFYSRWGFGMRESTNVDKARALQKAQTDLLTTKDYSHPHFWAPFVLIGDAR